MITYYVQYRRKGKSSYHNSTTFNTTTYIISNLTRGTVYEVRVASVGRLGETVFCCGSGKEVTTYDSECAVHTDHL